MRCVIRHAWIPKFQMSGPTVHSYTVNKRTCKNPFLRSSVFPANFESADSRAPPRGSGTINPNPDPNHSPNPNPKPYPNPSPNLNPNPKANPTVESSHSDVKVRQFPL